MLKMMGKKIFTIVHWKNCSSKPVIMLSVIITTTTPLPTTTAPDETPTVGKSLVRGSIP